ncbi:TOBE domain-containing protein [Aurantimonas sp. VKM B-3413]|uniref:TOBE domain-containing protein n=1 Tax=Aurantimonas sp. VKM B-3413 TaxID=2779401 RepID=UPI0027148D93|nr:TOBE domain-containing protein [Aurantimonas sp. VKM B-3413]
MADKIVVMRGGHVVQIGTPLDLYDRPANVFVAGFIGSPAMNLLTGSVHPSGTAFVSQVGARIAFPAPVGVGAGRDVVLGLRPEDIAIAESGLDARVRIVEPTGAELQVILDFQGETLTAVLHGRPDIREGETIKIALPHETLHLFDKQSGDRLAATR